MIFTNFNLGKQITAFVCSLIGLILIFVNPEVLLKILTYTIVIILLIKSLIMISYISNVNQLNKSKYTYHYFYHLITILLSLIFFFFPTEIMLIIIGTIFILDPILKIILSKFEKNIFFKNILKIIFGLFILIIGFNVLINIMFKSFGAIFLLIALLNIILIIKNKNNPPEDFYINNQFFSTIIKEKNDIIIDGEIINEKDE